jgi:hypothetical protein
MRGVVERQGARSDQVFGRRSRCSAELAEADVQARLTLLIDPQNDFFLTPTPLNVVDAGKPVPDSSTEAALRHV